MGGSLYGLGRLPRAEYLALEARLRSDLDRMLGQHYQIPRYYRSKEDFGDVDVVVSEAAITTTWSDLRDALVAGLGLTRFQRTGAVFSTVYQGFQVDYIVRPARYFESTCAFLDFNDLGNLLGKIFRRMNLKYGERGLQYVFRRADGNYTRDIDVSRDIQRICSHLSLDVAHWETGFETLEEMYAWLVASPWFSVAPYRDPSRTTRTRARQRPTIRRFLEWLDEEGIDTRVDYPPREACLPHIIAAFPEAGLPEILAAEAVRERQVAAVKERFGGKRVMQLIPGLSGPQLGAFIKTFREGFADFESEISSLAPAEVDRRVLAHWEAFEGRSSGLGSGADPVEDDRD
ncbi:MAG: hypothetical protein P8R54_12390 [Myxococcota bacterium]|nr:hypothetical protein [Myxococcota bacterium]